MSTTRFALLFGDDIIVDVLAIAAAFGDYAHTFCQLLASSLGPIITEVAFPLDAYVVVHDIIFPSDDVRYDGLASTEDHTPWVIELLDHVKHILAGQPSLKPHGLCFGRQIITEAPRYFIKQEDWEVSVTKPRSYPHQRLGVLFKSRSRSCAPRSVQSRVRPRRRDIRTHVGILTGGSRTRLILSDLTGLVHVDMPLRRPGMIEDALSKDGIIITKQES